MTTFMSEGWFALFLIGPVEGSQTRILREVKAWQQDYRGCPAVGLVQNNVIPWSRDSDHPWWQSAEEVQGFQGFLFLGPLPSIEGVPSDDELYGDGRRGQKLQTQKVV